MSIETSDQGRSAPHIFNQIMDTRQPDSPTNMFLKPLDRPTREGYLYSKRPIGKNTIDKWLKNLCEMAEITARTNHALQRTTVVRLIDAGYPIDQVQVATGHRSTTAVKRYYEQNDSLQIKRLNAIRPPRLPNPHIRPMPIPAPKKTASECGFSLNGITNCQYVTITVNQGMNAIPSSSAVEPAEPPLTDQEIDFMLCPIHLSDEE